MCICINCKFYPTCWITNALVNFPKYYKSLNNKVRNYKEIYKNEQFYLPTTLEIQLNISTRNFTREPDIIFCDAFIERPGTWLN